MKVQNEPIEIQVYEDYKQLLYYKDSKGTYKITELPGGAFYPSISSDGKLAFSVFRDGGYKLAIIK